MASAAGKIKSTRAELLRRRSIHFAELSRIDSELAELETHEHVSEIFTTRGPLPPGRSARWLREHAREMGGTRSGGTRGRGVLWTVTRAQYEAWLQRKRPDEGLDRDQEASNVVDIDSLINAAGFRATRSA